MKINDNDKILVSFKEMCNVMANVAVDITEHVKVKDKDLANFAFDITALFGAKITEKLWEEYQVKGEE